MNRVSLPPGNLRSNQLLQVTNFDPGKTWKSTPPEGPTPFEQIQEPDAALQNSPHQNTTYRMQSQNYERLL